MRANRDRSRAVVRRLLATTLTLVAFVVIAVPGPAGAVTKGQVDAAKQRLNDLSSQIAADQKQLETLQTRANAVAAQVLSEQGRLEQITGQLTATRAELAKAQADYEAVLKRLQDRARSTFMNGGGSSSLEFLLTASSLADLSDRLQYIDAVSQADDDIATQVQNLKSQLTDQAKHLQDLQNQQAKVVNGLKQQQAALQQQFDAQNQLVASIQAKKTEASKLYDSLNKKYQQQLAAQQVTFPTSSGGSGSGTVSGPNPFQNCPVGQPHAFGDDFGAPRYAGGFHLHAGNDILAPLGTPIYAPFSGLAYADSNSLGGLSVFVRGSQGYVYNAHLSRYGTLGNVSAGAVIGYVGNTGDAQGGPTHDHFEWHPNTIPSNWPASGYGYSVIGSAVNPNPLLAAVC